MQADKEREKMQRQAEILSNRVFKRFSHLHKRFLKEKIEIFRLYDWDIPEIRAVVDWYGGHLVIAEYLRKQSNPAWLPLMAEAVAEKLKVPMEKVHIKQRISGLKDGVRYTRLDHKNKKIIMHERDLKFLINPYDFIDTGLFADHRNTRLMVRQMAEGKSFLNLYCYTASFSCYAAKGGAKNSLSIDRSQGNLDWAKENFILNSIDTEKHKLLQADVLDYLKDAEKESFDIAVIDPPSYSKRRDFEKDFDINRDHPNLIAKVLKLMKKDGVIFFSTNHQDFKEKFDQLRLREVKEISHQTIAEDYKKKDKKIHRCWRILV